MSFTKIGLRFSTVHRVAQKVSHYHEASLNRIKPAIMARFFINFDYKLSTRI